MNLIYLERGRDRPLTGVKEMVRRLVIAALMLFLLLGLALAEASAQEGKTWMTVPLRRVFNLVILPGPEVAGQVKDMTTYLDNEWVALDFLGYQQLGYVWEISQQFKEEHPNWQKGKYSLDFYANEGTSKRWLRAKVGSSVKTPTPTPMPTRKSKS